MSLSEELGTLYHTFAQCQMTIACTGTFPHTFSSHMKKRGFNRRFSKLSDFIRIKDIKNFLEEQVPLVDIPDKCLDLNSFNLGVFRCRLQTYVSEVHILSTVANSNRNFGSMWTFQTCDHLVG